MHVCSHVQGTLNTDSEDPSTVTDTQNYSIYSKPVPFLSRTLQHFTESVFGDNRRGIMASPSTRYSLVVHDNNLQPEDIQKRPRSNAFNSITITYICNN